MIIALGFIVFSRSNVQPIPLMVILHLYEAHLIIMPFMLDPRKH